MNQTEQEFADFLQRNNVKYTDYTDSLIRPDFYFEMKSNDIWVEIKEKRNPYNLKNWPDFTSRNIPESSAFIEDEFSIRRMLYYGPHSFLLIKTLTKTKKFYYCGLLELLTMGNEITRNNRIISKGNLPKGKWLMDLRTLYCSDIIKDFFYFVYKRLKYGNVFYGITEENQYTPCFNPHNKEISNAGILRTNDHREIDLNGNSMF